MSKKSKQCPICGVPIWHESRWCRVHAPREKVFQSGKKHWNWKGGKFITKQGYVRIYAPDHPCVCIDGHILEHRLVMEKKIGRSLLPDEDVHHKDHNRQNNSIENLELISHKEHGKNHAIEEWTERKFI